MRKPLRLLLSVMAILCGIAVIRFAKAQGEPISIVAGAACVVAGIGLAVIPVIRNPAQTKAPLPIRRKPKPVPSANDNDPDSLVAQMLGQGRYALLLRPQVAQDLEQHQFETTLETLQTAMALVPDGTVILGEIGDGKDEQDRDDAGWHQRQRAIRVAPYFLDRYPVTNRQFFEFVASGGYEQITYWDTAIWPAVLDFVDQTQQPGPRYWSDGYFGAGEEEHPVVGISWYEASAYARWAGKRLPTDAEWVKAGVWPVSVSETQSSQRRFPWGNTMDRTKANIWGSGPGQTVPVTDLPDGVSVGGIYHLIGNVWEWTRSDYIPSCFPPEEFISQSPLKSVRGGAYDTYFDNQATCQFQSGDVQMARQRNIGFRCALSVCDLMLYHNSAPESRDDEVPEEVIA